jgi:hypothetical protein
MTHRSRVPVLVLIILGLAASVPLQAVTQADLIAAAHHKAALLKAAKIKAAQKRAALLKAAQKRAALLKALAS